MPARGKQLDGLGNLIPEAEKYIVSDPPAGKKKITNIYWDPVTEEIVVEYE